MCVGEENSRIHNRESKIWTNNNSYLKFCWANKIKNTFASIDDSNVLHLFWLKQALSFLRGFLFHDPQSQQV